MALLPTFRVVKSLPLDAGSYAFTANVGVGLGTAPSVVSCQIDWHSDATNVTDISVVENGFASLSLNGGGHDFRGTVDVVCASTALGVYVEMLSINAIKVGTATQIWQ